MELTWELIVAGAAAIKVPSLLEASVKSAGERLLGPVVDRWAQPIKDRVAQRTKIAEAIAAVASKHIADHPDLVAFEVKALLADAGLKYERIASTFQKSLQYLPLDTVDSPSDVSDDWLNRWRRYVEDASSDELQDAFARILAGQMAGTTTFSISTLRVVSEMSSEIAHDFQKVWNGSLPFFAIKYPEYERGPEWTRVKRLKDAGLVSPVESELHFTATNEPIGFGAQPVLEVRGLPGRNLEVPAIRFTLVGEEVGSILPSPDIEANLRRMARECPNRHQWVDATLVRVAPEGLVRERLYPYQSEPTLAS